MRFFQEKGGKGIYLDFFACLRAVRTACAEATAVAQGFGRRRPVGTVGTGEA